MTLPERTIFSLLPSKQAAQSLHPGGLSFSPLSKALIFKSLAKLLSCPARRELYRFPVDGHHNKRPQKRRLKTAQIHHLVVLEVRFDLDLADLKSRRQWGCVPSGVSRECFLAFSHF